MVKKVSLIYLLFLPICIWIMISLMYMLFIGNHLKGIDEIKTNEKGCIIDKDGKELPNIPGLLVSSSNWRRGKSSYKGSWFYTTREGCLTKGELSEASLRSYYTGIPLGLVLYGLLLNFIHGGPVAITS